MTLPKICYIGGCGRLGLPLAVWSAHKGYDVICADVDEYAVDRLNAGHPYTSEPDVQALISDNLTRIRATTDTIEAVRDSELIFVIVPTPSEPDGSFSLRHILNCCDDMSQSLRRGATVIIVSTVMPGATEGEIKRQLELSGKRAGLDFNLTYSPEFIRQGSIVADFANPAQILIGEFDRRSGDVAQAYYECVTESDPPTHRMSLVSAEIAKIGLNAAVVTKLAVANQLAWMCQGYPDADAKDVLRAIGADPRIGSAYFSAGPPDGGPCFPRDSRALVVAAAPTYTEAPIARAMDLFREEQYDNILNWIGSRCSRGDAIGILGLTYKPGVDITEESPGMILCSKLRGAGYSVVAHDPAVSSLSLADCVANSDALVVTTPWPQFESLGTRDLSDKIVFDLWGFFDDDELDCKEYHRLGRGEMT